MEKIKAFIQKCGIPIICALCALLLIFMVYFRCNAQSTGEKIGQSAGIAAGRAVGSVEGLTAGQAEGYAAGKEAGLNAEDTEVEISGKIKEVQNLQVLVASGTYSDVLKIGTEYAALFTQKYEVIFKVDLSTADIRLDKSTNTLEITIDDPEAEFHKKGDAEIEKEDGEKHLYSENAQEGYDSAIKSIGEIEESVIAEFNADNTLMDAARSSAKTQLEQLAKAVSVSGTKLNVEVLFRGSEVDGE